MATYLRNNLELKETDEIYVEVPSFTSEPYKCFVGKSQKERHLGTFTFLDINKKDTIFGNGYRLRSWESVIKTVYEIAQKNKVKVNGEAVELWVKIV